MSDDDLAALRAALDPLADEVRAEVHALAVDVRELRAETRYGFDRIGARIDGMCERIDAACEPQRRPE